MLKQRLKDSMIKGNNVPGKGNMALSKGDIFQCAMLQIRKQSKKNVVETQLEELNLQVEVAD